MSKAMREAAPHVCGAASRIALLMPRLYSPCDGPSRIFKPGHAVVGETAPGAVGSVVAGQVLKRVEQVLWQGEVAGRRQIGWRLCRHGVRRGRRRAQS